MSRSLCFEILIVCCLLVISGQPYVRGQEAGGIGGDVSTLPGVGTGQDRNRLLAGHVNLLARSLEQAIDDLQHAELKKFTESYRRMVDAYNQLGDHVGDASESIGDAETKIMLASRRLQVAGAAESVEPERRRKLNEDIGQVRAMMIGKLGAVRARYEQASAEDQGRMLRQMHAIVSRIKQLDKLGSAVTNGSRPIIPGLAARELAQHLSEVQESLQEEEKMLGVISESVRLLVDSTTEEMRRTVRLVEVQARIPDELVAELTETRRTVQQMLDQVAGAQQRATESAIAILTESELSEELPDEESLFGEIEQLLGSQNAGALGRE